MPMYLYKHPSSGEVVEVLQSMKDDHIYVDDDGVQWDRVWVAPNASMDSLSQVDPFNEKEFVRKTENMNGTVGDIWDYSKELSEKRMEKDGKDVIKEKWSKERAKKMTKKRRENMIKEAKKKSKILKDVPNKSSKKKD